MRIRVADIPEEGLRIDGPEPFDRPFQDPTWVLDDASLAVEKDGDAIFVHGSLVATVPQLCGRCLAGFDVTVTPSIEARFVPSPTGRGDEHELGADDLETETSLALPMKPLCREECRGLCPVCGENRNTTACACEERAPELRWEPLKAWAARQSR